MMDEKDVKRPFWQVPGVKSIISDNIQTATLKEAEIP